MIPLAPSTFDVWFITVLGHYPGKWPFFDLCIQHGIRHNVLGGLWFAATLFVFWSRVREGDGSNRLRVVTTLLASGVAILLATFVGHFFLRLPPNRTPGLAYPEYLLVNPNGNCFPSLSAALYSSVAAGISSLNRKAGAFLWVLVIVLVALPRIYVGGHYPTDDVAGVALGILAYFLTRMAEKRWGARAQRWFSGNPLARTAGVLVVFVWIFQIAVEFREAEWARHSVEVLMHVDINATAESLRGIMWP